MRAEPFTLKSGQQSRRYIDCRPILCTPAGREAIADLVGETIDEHFDDIDTIAGVPLGGLLIATAVVDHIERTATPSETSGRWLVVPRTEAKPHGTGHAVEMHPGCLADRGRTPIVLLEDVITTGGSVEQAGNILEAAGFDVVGVIALVCRGDSWSAPWQSCRRVVSLFTLDDLVGPEPAC